MTNLSRFTFTAVMLFALRCYAASEPEAPSCHTPDSMAGMTPVPSAQATTAPVKKIVIAPGPYIFPTPDNLVVSQESLGKGVSRSVVIFKKIHIDKVYPSMGGPWSRTYLPMNTQDTSSMWITRYRAEVLDSSTGKAAQEFMCHTKLDLFGGGDVPVEMRGVKSQFVISQGQTEVNFPKGFALRVDSHPQRKIDLNIMVLNNNPAKPVQDVDFKATVDSMDDAAARRKKIVPLFETAASIYCPEPECQTASLSSEITDANGQKRTGHWIVPPGRHETSSPIYSLVKYDTTIHYMLMHLHPYAESIELRDLTTGKTLWKGMAKTSATEPILLSTDYYSSTRGLPVYNAHHYELVAVYNNTTSQPIDAMGSLWMYAQEKN